MSCSAKFRPDEDEQLIELVHAHPCLWNMTDPEFKKEKRFIWAEIGRKLTKRPRTGIECKSRWRSIRDYYKKQKKDEKSGMEVPVVKRRQVYWNSLSFLDDADDELKALSNVQVELSEVAEALDPVSFEDAETDGIEAIIRDVPPKRRKPNEEDRRERGNREEEHDQIMHEDGSCKMSEDTEEISSERLEYQFKENFKILRDRRVPVDHTGLEQDVVDDEIYLFFRAMAATVKRFSPKLKAVTKARVFTIINELEMRHLETECPH